MFWSNRVVIVSPRTSTASSRAGIAAPLPATTYMSPRRNASSIAAGARVGALTIVQTTPISLRFVMSWTSSSPIAHTALPAVSTLSHQADASFQ